MICRGELELFDLDDNVTYNFLSKFVAISNSYSNLHKYIVVPICSLGSIINTIHLFVLTRPNMKNSSVNLLISLIAICDICTMISYTIYESQFDYFITPAEPPVGFSIQWVVFAIAHGVLSIALHSITLYLWVATAFIRFKSIRDITKNGFSHGYINYVGYIFLTILVSVAILCIPSILIHDIITVSTNEDRSLYSIGISKLAAKNNCFLFKLNLWLTGILFKAIPSVLLVVFTIALFTELSAKRKQRQLIINGNKKLSKNHKTKSEKMTLMLVVLLSVFVCTELPQGALAILNGLYPNDIHKLVYSHLGEFLDLLSLINCNTCFVIYAIMSSAYRETLKRIIQNVFHNCKKSSIWQPINASNFNSSNNQFTENSTRRNLNSPIPQLLTKN